MGERAALQNDSHVTFFFICFHISVASWIKPRAVVRPVNSLLVV